MRTSEDGSALKTWPPTLAWPGTPSTAGPRAAGCLPETWDASYYSDFRRSTPGSIPGAAGAATPPTCALPSRADDTRWAGEAQPRRAELYGIAGTNRGRFG